MNHKENYQDLFILRDPEAKSKAFSVLKTERKSMKNAKGFWFAFKRHYALICL